MRMMNYICGIVAVAAISTGTYPATNRAPTPVLAGFPSPIVWQNKPAEWNANANYVALTAGKKTNWFVYPGGGYAADSSPRLLFKPTNDFMFSTKVEAKSHATCDAGCPALYASTSTWAKLRLEAQAGHRLDSISVVTHGSSDDATSFPANGTSIYLKNEGLRFFS